MYFSVEYTGVRTFDHKHPYGGEQWPVPSAILLCGDQGLAQPIGFIDYNYINNEMEMYLWLNPHDPNWEAAAASDEKYCLSECFHPLWGKTKRLWDRRLLGHRTRNGSGNPADCFDKLLEAKGIHGLALYFVTPVSKACGHGEFKLLCFDGIEVISKNPILRSYVSDIPEVFDFASNTDHNFGYLSPPREELCNYPELAMCHQLWTSFVF